MSHRLSRLFSVLAVVCLQAQEPLNALAGSLAVPSKCNETAIELVKGGASITLENARVGYSSARGCKVTGNMRVVINGNNVLVSGVKGRVDSLNNYTADTAGIPSFDLTIAGITFLVKSAAFTNGSLILQTVRIKLPEDWGGLEGPGPSGMFISDDGLSAVRFDLPSLKTKKGFELELSGAIRVVTGGYEIDADGSLGFPDTAKRIPGCAIGVGVTLYWKSYFNQSALYLAAGVLREPGSTEARRSAIMLPDGQAPLAPEDMPVRSYYLPVPSGLPNPFEAALGYGSANENAGQEASQPYEWAVWQDGQYDQPVAYSDGDVVVGLPATDRFAEMRSRNATALIGPVSSEAAPQAPEGLELWNATVSMQCDKGIPLGASGFELTGASGELSLRPDSQYINLHIVIESSAKLGDLSLLQADADATFEWKPDYVASLSGILTVFSFFRVADASLSLNFTKKAFAGTITLRGVIFEASVSLRAWADFSPFKFHFTGSGQLRVGVAKGEIWEGCVGIPCGIKWCRRWWVRYPCGIKMCNVCLSIPPATITLGEIGADFGEFTNGSYGIKGTVSFMGYSIGAYVDTKGNVKFGNVSGYKLVDSPTVQLARNTVLEAQRQGSAADRVTQDGVTYAFPADQQVVLGFNTPLAPAWQAGLAPADTISTVSVITQTDTLFSVKSDAPLTVSLISPPPGNVEISASNYLSKPGGFTVDYQRIVTYALERAVDNQGRSQVEALRNEVRLRMIPALYHDSLPFQTADFWLDGRRILSGVSLTLTDQIDYQPIASGTHAITLTAAGSPTPVLSSTFQAISGTAYTILPAGSLGGASGLRVDAAAELPAGAVPAHAAEDGYTCFAMAGEEVSFSSMTASAVRDAIASVSPPATVKVAGYCPEWFVNPVVAIDREITLVGGYTPADWSVSYPLTQPTILDAQGGGRVIYATAPVSLVNLTIQNGAVAGHGAGAYFYYVPATLEGVTFINNAATGGGYGGGAAFFDRATVNNTTFISNSTGTFGGGMAVMADADVSHSTFASNTASADGGGAYFSGPATINSSTFISNTSIGQYGGGAAFHGAATVSQSVFAGNRAPYGGGAHFGNPGDNWVVNTLFARNQATGGAAVLVVDNAALRLMHTTIASPTQASGAAVLVGEGVAYITNTVIASHTTGIQNQGGSATTWNALFHGNASDTNGAVTNHHPVYGDPRFVNQSADNDRLGGGSAAIDAGAAPQPDVTTDIDGDVRPLLGGYDIGYDEARHNVAPGAGMSVLADDNQMPLEFGRARARFVNLDVTTPASGAITITLPAATIGGLAYQQASPYQTVPAGALPMQVTNGYGQVVVSDTLDLAEGEVKTVFIMWDGNTLETVDESYRLFTVTQYVVDQAPRGYWQVKLEGDTSTANFGVAAVEAPNPPIAKNLMVDASDLSHTVVSYTLLTEAAPVYVRVFANNGPVTETIAVSETLNTTPTVRLVTVPVYEGVEMAVITVTQPVSDVASSQVVNLKALESGNYTLWLRVEDGRSAPVEGYVLGGGAQHSPQILADNAVRVAAEDYDPLRQLSAVVPIHVDNTASFSASWTTALTSTINPRFIRADPAGRSPSTIETIPGLFLEYTPYNHPDVDGYIVRVTDNRGMTDIITAGLSMYDRYDEFGNFLYGPVNFATFNGILPRTTYTVEVGARDFDTGRIAWSQPFVTYVPSGDFQIRAQPPEIRVGTPAPAVVTATLVLTMTNDLFSDVSLYLNGGNNLTDAIQIKSIAYQNLSTLITAPGPVLPAPRRAGTAASQTTVQARVALTITGVPPGLYALPFIAYSDELTRQVTFYLNVAGQPVVVPSNGGVFPCSLPQATSARGLTVTIPAGAFSGNFDLRCQQGASNLSEPGARFAGLLFSVQAFQAGTSTPVTPTRPFTLTIAYGTDWYGPLLPSLLALRSRAGAAWTPSGIACANNLAQQVLTCSVARLTDYALFDLRSTILYLPTVRK
jgi:hypothetical protein